MTAALRNYLFFLRRCIRTAFTGDWRYYAWMGALTVVCLFGLNAYAKQLVTGLITTGMTDEVSWGVYIANFTFLVGVGAAAVMMVIPVYIYKNEELHDLVIFGELLAIAAIMMCLAFVTVDLGRPDRFWHLIPPWGQMNFPASMLSWDVIVLNGYLLLNLHICGYLLYCRYQGRLPSKWFYIPFVFVAIIWAISIHTVTAFLYVGLGGRSFWNSAIVGPRFLASAFAAGPALIILAMQVVRRVTATRTTLAASLCEDCREMEGRPATTSDFNLLAAHLPELADLPAPEQARLIEDSRVIEAPANALLLRQGDASGVSYLLLSGRVVVQRDEDGRARITRTVGPGGQFGEVSALHNLPRSASAVTEIPTTVLRIPTATLRRLLQDKSLGKRLHARMTERLMITDRALLMLRSIVQVAMIINVFLLVNEVFKEFYSGTHHVASAQYLLFGLHGYNALVPWIWVAISLNLIGMTLLILPLSRSLKWLDVACVCCIVGIWIEKGMGLVVPGFIPTPLGDIVEYSPSWNETLVSLGIWSFGLMLYTVLLRVAVPILQGRMVQSNEAEEAAAS
jgi:Ni/Fe-hydrogenase subunit HybB-like protein